MSTNGTKHIATSKTAWVNALAVTIVALIPGAEGAVFAGAIGGAGS